MLFPLKKNVVMNKTTNFYVVSIIDITKHVLWCLNDTAVLLTKNKIRAVKKNLFSQSFEEQFYMKIERVQTEFDACSVDLSSVLVRAIREECLLSSDQENMACNI